jgi:hypothetical protein
MGIPELADRLKTAPAQVLRAVFSGIGRMVLEAERSEDRTTGRDRTEAAKPGSAAARAKNSPATAKNGPATAKDRPATAKDSSATAKDRAASGKTSPAAGTKGQVSGQGQNHRQQPSKRSRQRDASPAPAPSSRWRSLDTTGNVRLLSAEDLDDGSAGAQELRADPGIIANPPAADISATQTSVGHADAAEPAAADRLAAEPAAAEAPGDTAAPAAADLAAADPAAEPTADGRAAIDHDAAAALPMAGYDGLSLPSIRARLRNLDAVQLAVLAAYERTHAERPDVLGMLERRIEKLETGR